MKNNKRQKAELLAGSPLTSQTANVPKNIKIKFKKGVLKINAPRT